MLPHDSLQRVKHAPCCFWTCTQYCKMCMESAATVNTCSCNLSKLKSFAVHLQLV